MNERDIRFKKTSVIFTVIMSFLTLGIYHAYWFLTRRSSFEELSAKDWIPYKWWKISLFPSGFFIINSLFGSLILTDYGLEVLQSYDIIFTFYLIGLLYYSVFRAKEMIENELGEEIFKPWLLVLCHIWYLQYHLNKLSAPGRELDAKIQMA